MTPMSQTDYSSRQLKKVHTYAAALKGGKKLSDELRRVEGSQLVLGLEGLMTLQRTRWASRGTRKNRRRTNVYFARHTETPLIPNFRSKFPNCPQLVNLEFEKPSKHLEASVLIFAAPSCPKIGVLYIIGRRHDRA